jgi:hypothetical protein
LAQDYAAGVAVINAEGVGELAQDYAEGVGELAQDYAEGVG